MPLSISLALRALFVLTTLATTINTAGCLGATPVEEEEGELAEAQQAVEAQNLALGKPTSQSSTYGVSLPSTVSSSAVDGNTDGTFGNGSVTHTNSDYQAWWQVDLQSSRAVGDVVVWNRTDCCSDRLSNFKLLVSDDGQSWQSYPYAGTAPTQLSFAVNRSARYVKVQLNGTSFLSLAEVQVFASPNLALGKPTSQSSTYAGSLASTVSSSAADGNTDGTFGNGSVTHTNSDYQAWWQVDLQSSQAVGDVVVWNRTDCCSDRLSNFKLLVSDDGQSWQSYPYAGTAPTQLSFAVNRSARYVKVQLNGTSFLSLAEVQVLPALCAPGQVALDSTSCVTLTPWDGGAIPDGARIAMRASTRFKNDNCNGCTGVESFGPAWVGLTSYQWNGGVPVYNYINANGASLTSNAIFTATVLPRAQNEYVSGNNPWSYQKLVLKAADGSYVGVDGSGALAAKESQSNASILILDETNGTQAGFYYTGYTYPMNASMAQSHTTLYGISFRSINGLTMAQFANQGGFSAASFFELFIVS